MKRLFVLLVFIIIVSCGEIDFVYNKNENIINPLYEKTKVVYSGANISFINSYVSMFFGKNKENTFDLLINIQEKKTKRSIETNQAASDLRYELRFSYTLLNNSRDCIAYEKELLSYFTIIPKSEGYNYGTDSSLEKKYELAVTDNLDQFISFLSGIDIYGCK